VQAGDRIDTFGEKVNKTDTSGEKVNKTDTSGEKVKKTVTVVYYPGLLHYDATAPLL
jgi:hypothetical protein